VEKKKSIEKDYQLIMIMRAALGHTLAANAYVVYYALDATKLWAW